MQDIDLLKYIYIEYSIAVLVATELVRFFVAKLHYGWAQYMGVTQPKWITLIMATVLAVADWVFIGNAQTFNLYQMLTSFGVAVLGYDYIWKIVKDQFGSLVRAWTKKD